MRKYKKPLPLLEKVTILDAGAEGKAVARVGEMVVFVPFVAPGDVVDIQVIRKKKSYMDGKAVHFHSYSSQRAEPFCQHFGLCGGCKWQHLRYEDQLFYKQKQVVDAFVRIGKLDFPAIRPIIPSPNEQYYRNKLEYTFSNRRWLDREEMEVNPDMRGLGFHLPALFDRVLDIKSCYLQRDPSDTIREKARELCLATGLPFYDARNNVGFFRNLWIRTSNSGDVLVILVVGENRPDIIHHVLNELAAAFPGVTSWMYVVNEKHNDTIHDQEVILYKGKGYLEEKMDKLLFRVGPLSFFQVNDIQAIKLYEMTLDALQLSGNEVIYDLYTGIGTIAMVVAGKAAKVIGIEYVEGAVEDARLNSGLNNIKNTVFFTGDIARLLTADFFEREGKPAVIITDPPRAGMAEKVIEQILLVSPEKIAYISCNPATQARDLALMSQQYDIEIVQPFDMFPHTHHVECLVVMKRK